MQKTILLLLWLSFASTMQSVYAGDIEDGAFWLGTNIQSELTEDKWNWYMEVQPRWREEGSEFAQMLIRPAIFYKISPSSSAWLGYARITTHPANASNTDENRLWLQFLHQFEAVGDWKIQSRTRLEQRFIESKDDTGYRLRQMLKIVKPISATRPLSFIASNELFINMNDTDWGANRGLDQNRAFIGFGYKLHANANLELGYLNQRVNSLKNKENHVLSMGWSFNF